MYFNSVKPNILVRVILCVIALASVTCIATPAYAQSDSDTLMTVTEPDTVRMAVDTTTVAMDTLVAASDTPAVATDSLANDTVRHAIAALKNNLLYDAIATMNLHTEFRLDEHWTLEAGVGFNPFPLDDKKFPKWRHVYVDIAPRYWFCQAFTRDFVSANIGYAHYNVAGSVYPVGWMYKDVKTNRFQGDALLFGASYGWVFPITPFFSIELEGGVDAGVTWYDQFTCVHCGKQLAEKQKAWFALPRVGVNLVVLLDDNKPDFEDRCDCGKLHTYEEETVEETAADTIAETPTDTMVAVVPVAQDTVVVAQDTAAAAPVPVITEPETTGDSELEPEEEEYEEDEESLEEIEKAIEQSVLPPYGAMIDSIRHRVHEIEKEIGANPSDSLWQVVDSLVSSQEELAHKSQMRRLRETILRPLPEFEPYDRNKRVESEPNCIYMHFDVDKTNVDRAFIHNDELMDSIMTVIDEALHDPTIEIKLIKIVGMASFDGPLATNERLGQSRAEALRDYIQSRFHFDESIYRLYNGGECWQELRWYLEQEKFPNKQEVMMIIDSEPDVEMREWIIKHMENGVTYRYMRRHFNRYLRNLGTITVYYKTKKQKSK